MDKFLLIQTISKTTVLFIPVSLFLVFKGRRILFIHVYLFLVFEGRFIQFIYVYTLYFKEK